jgi:hypothetical protein
MRPPADYVFHKSLKLPSPELSHPQQPKGQRLFRWSIQCDVGAVVAPARAAAGQPTNAVSRNEMQKQNGAFVNTSSRIKQSAFQRMGSLK